MMVLRAGISAAYAAFEPAINGSGACPPVSLPDLGLDWPPHTIEAKAAMLNRATPPERPEVFEGGFFYLWVRPQNTTPIFRVDTLLMLPAFSFRDPESSELSR